MRTTLAVILVGSVLLAVGPGCKPKIPVIDTTFVDNFERAGLGPDWFDTGKSAGMVNGKLNVVKSYNHPVWLRRKLPRNVQIDFDAVSRSPAGDIKVELYGDGESFDRDRGRYDPTGYMVVLGGWNNSRSIIGRLGEHDEAVKAAYDRVGSEPIVLPGHPYHFTITRRGGTIEWQLGGRRYLSWTDPEPLAGPGHEFFAVNDWEADVLFDNLVIKPVN